MKLVNGQKYWCSEQGRQAKRCTYQGPVYGFAGLCTILLRDTAFMCNEASLFDTKEEAQKEIDKLLAEPEGFSLVGVFTRKRVKSNKKVAKKKTVKKVSSKSRKKATKKTTKKK